MCVWEASASLLVPPPKLDFQIEANPVRVQVTFTLYVRTGLLDTDPFLSSVKQHRAARQPLGQTSARRPISVTAQAAAERDCAQGGYPPYKRYTPAFLPALQQPDVSSSEHDTCTTCGCSQQR